MITFDYRDKVSCKNKMLEISKNKFVKTGDLIGLDKCLSDIDSMQPGDSATWEIEMNFKDGYSNSCEIRLKLPKDLNLLKRQEREEKKHDTNIV